MTTRKHKKYKTKKKSPYKKATRSLKDSRYI